MWEIVAVSVTSLLCPVGGAGGKGVWGAPGQVYTYQEPDARDPNYDDVAQVTAVWRRRQ